MHILCLVLYLYTLFFFFFHHSAFFTLIDVCGAKPHAILHKPKVFSPCLFFSSSVFHSNFCFFAVVVRTMHGATQRGGAESLQQPSPFIVASPSASPTHVAHAQEDAAAAITTTTTTIHMDSVDELASSTTSSPQRSAKQAAAQSNTSRGGTTSLAASQLVASRSSLSTYQLASAALRRLPGRPAPLVDVSESSADSTTVHHAPHLQNSAEVDSIVDEQNRREELLPPFAAQARTSDASTGHADTSHGVTLSSPPQQSSARSREPSPQSSSAAQPSSIRGPSSGRFRVPPVPSAVASSPRAAPSSTHQRRHPSYSSSSLSTSPRAHPSVNRASRSVSRTEGDDDQDEDDEAEDEDVAARVLSSLQLKDDVIQQLTRAVSTLERENAALRRTPATTSRGGETVDRVSTTPPRDLVRSLFSAAGQGTTPESQRVPRRSSDTHATADQHSTSSGLDTPTRSPSLPLTPVRWWKKKPSNANQADARMAPAIRRAGDQESSDVTGPLQGRAPATVPDGNADGYLPGDVADHHGAAAAAVDSLPETRDAGNVTSLMTALEAAQTRVAELEYQLDTLREEKREEQRTLREHIDHLTRELNAKAKESRRQERQHKRELTGLQREVTALADQLEDQLRAATAINASTTSQHEALQRQLEEARLREEALTRENKSAQQHWLHELEEQRRLLEDARAAVRTADAQAHARTQHEKTLIQQLTEQQQQVEAQVEQWKRRVGQAQKDLAELRAVHQRTEEDVAMQRAAAQELTEALAAATLQHTHDEQRVEQLEVQGDLLRQQLRNMEEALTSREAELVQLRQEREDEVDHLLTEQDEEHRKLLVRVEGCMKGSEAMEGALLEAEAKRRDLAAQLARTQAERDDLHCRLRENSVNTQAQLLEQQQLFHEGQGALQQRLHEAQRSAADSSGALEATQRELTAVRERLQHLDDEHRNALAANAKLESTVQELELAQSRQTAHLVQTKESLKNALHEQLRTTSMQRRTEQQLRALRAAARRTEERRVEEQRALQRIVTLLWSTDDPQGQNKQQQQPSLPQRFLIGDVQARTAAAVVRARATVADSAQSMLDEEEEGNGDGDDVERSDAALRLASSAAAFSEASSTVAESVAMSAVNITEANLTDTASVSSTHGESEEEEEEREVQNSNGNGNGNGGVGDGRARQQQQDRQRPRQELLPNGDSSFKATKRGNADAAAATLNKTTTTPSGHVRLSTSANRDCLPSTPCVTTRTSTEELSALRALTAIYDAVKQLLHAHGTAVSELGTKRTAVRTLLLERKTQHAALEAAHAALAEQRSEAARQQRSFTKAFRAEAKTALEDLKTELEERHAEELTRVMGEERQRHTQQQQQGREAFVALVRRQLMSFITQLPATVQASLTSVSLPAEVEHTEEKEAEVQQQQQQQQQQQEQQEQQRWMWASQAHPTGGEDAPYYDYDYTYDHQKAASAASHAAREPSTTELFTPAGTAPEVKAECDQIAREILGLAGGWHDLTSAAAAAAVPASPPPPPAYYGAMRYGEDPLPYRPHASNEESLATSAAKAARAAIFDLPESTSWTTNEMAELREVMGAYLTQSFARLDKEHQQVDATRSANDKAAAKTFKTLGGKEETDQSQEPQEHVSVAMGLRQWMRSLRQSDLLSTSPPTGQPSKGDSDDALTSVKAATDAITAETEVLALLLNACVVHVVENVLRDGVVRVLE